MNETKKWICDKCKGEIKNVEDGWVEWLTIRDNQSPLGYKEKYMRIVHRVDCIYTESEQDRYNAISSDSDLESFTGPDGLMQLLEFVSENRFEDKEEVLEVIKRIHIPGYEEARNYFEEAVSEGVFEPNTKPSYYSQIDINKVIQYKNRKK